jgi:hypothetical protein
MKCVGFAFVKQQIRYTALTGDKASPTFVEKDRYQYGAELSPTDICVWLNRNFRETLTRLKPDLVCYRMAWSYTKQEQAYSLVFPCAILELVCAEMKIPCKGFGAQAITAKALGFPKGANTTDYCTILIGEHKPNWDQQQINAALSAICGMH